MDEDADGVESAAAAASCAVEPTTAAIVVGVGATLLDVLVKLDVCVCFVVAQGFQAPRTAGPGEADQRREMNRGGRRIESMAGREMKWKSGMTAV